MGKKYLKIGQIIQTDNMKQPAVVLENGNLKEFLAFLKDFGAKNIGDKTKEEIYADKSIKGIFINMMSPFENQPNFVLNNLTLTIESDEDDE